MLSRRGMILGALFAPAIVKAENLMPVSSRLLRPLSWHDYSASLPWEKASGVCEEYTVTRGGQRRLTKIILVNHRGENVGQVDIPLSRNPGDRIITPAFLSDSDGIGPMLRIPVPGPAEVRPDGVATVRTADVAVKYGGRDYWYMPWRQR